MKLKIKIESKFGNAEFEAEANNEQELQEIRERFKPLARIPHRETVYIYGLDCDYFEQLW